MTGPSRRWLSLTVVLVLMVLFFWQCTGAFDRNDEAAPISVFGPWLGDEAEAFDAVLDDFTADTGIEVDYTGSSDFDGDLRQRIAGGLGLPDVAMIPQPALFAELIVLGVVEPLSEQTVDAIVDNFGFTRNEIVAFEDQAYLAPYRNNVKSLVWYRPDVFEEQGWTIPETLDELGDFAAEVADTEIDGTEIAPWCFTMEAGAATGWATTDWVEDLVLRRGGLEAYREWVSGVRPFDDAVIRDAFAEFDELVLAPGHVAGGTQRVLSTGVEEGSAPLFDDPPGCAMYKQASFATTWFPDDVEIGPDGDVDFFVLPGVDADEAPPILVGGDGALRFSDRQEVADLMTFLVTTAGTEAWIDRGGFLSGRTSTDLDEYDDVDRRFAELLIADGEQAFDASDSFLSEIREALLTQITTFVAEANYLDTDDEVDQLVEAVEEVRQDVLGGRAASDEP